MSAKVSIEASPKEPSHTSLEPPPASSGEAVLSCGREGVPKNAQLQPHTTTAFLLPGEHCAVSQIGYTFMKYTFYTYHSSELILNSWVLSRINLCSFTHIGSEFIPQLFPGVLLLFF